jgi:prephenate dehydratase
VPSSDTPGRIAYLGPPGTVSEEALRAEPDLARGEHIDLASIPDVIDAVAAGDVDLGLVPLENAIDGAVTATLDQLAFEVDLFIQREVVISVQMNLLASPGATLADIEHVISIPVATAQCHGFLRKELPKATLHAATSTAEAARMLAESKDKATAAIGPGRAAEVYGLEVLAADIEDHPENQTRFGLLARPEHGIPGATGHDKTAIVVFQAADQPGSLLAILQEFAARSINLTNLHSRPTKRGLGDYCFMIDLEGHIADEVVADCLRELKSKQADVKFLGSFPAAGAHGPEVRRDADLRWRDANAWLQGLRGQVGPGR